MLKQLRKRSERPAKGKPGKAETCTCYLALDLLQLRLLLLQLHSELLLLFARGWRCPLSFLQNASTPGGSVSDPSTEIARQVHSADVRVRILFPLSASPSSSSLLSSPGSSSIRWYGGHLFFFPFQSSHRRFFGPRFIAQVLRLQNVLAREGIGGRAPGDGREGPRQVHTGAWGGA